MIRRLVAAARVLAFPLMLLMLVTACSSTSASAPRHLSVTVQPESSAADQSVQIRVAGLAAGEAATVQVTSTDAAATKWVASATYHANAGGVINPDQEAPVSGSYQGASGMGLIWSMRPATGPAPLGGYRWSGIGKSTSGIPAPMRFTVTVSAGRSTVARTTFQRGLADASLTTQPETLHADGFIGEFTHPTATTARHPAILVISGSGGGLPDALILSLLASHGYPALGVAYFAEPGLPPTLTRIPLEYFARALRWLAAQPGVDPAKIAVLGESRGSEAAQLLGVHYPSLVHAVIASVPSDAAGCSYPACTGPAWTLNGQPVPYTLLFDQPNPTDDPAAVIPDQQINGPMFLDCAQDDHTWPSCPFAEHILSQLDTHNDPWTHVLYTYPGTGHLLGAFDPYQPWGQGITAQAGPSFAADQEAMPVLWQHLLNFLAQFNASTPGH